MLVSDLSGSTGPLDASVASQKYIVKTKVLKIQSKSIFLSSVEQYLQSKAGQLNASVVPKLRKPVSVLRRS